MSSSVTFSQGRHVVQFENTQIIPCTIKWTGLAKIFNLKSLFNEHIWKTHISFTVGPKDHLYSVSIRKTALTPIHLLAIEFIKYPTESLSDSEIRFDTLKKIKPDIQFSTTPNEDRSIIPCTIKSSLSDKLKSFYTEHITKTHISFKGKNSFSVLKTALKLTPDQEEMLINPSASKIRGDRLCLIA